LGQRKSGLLRQTTLKRGSIHKKLSTTEQEKGDLLIQVTVYKSRTVFQYFFMFQDFYYDK